MLKFQPLVTTGAALLLVFPAAVLGDADVSSLGQALKETERALDVLRGIESGRSQPENPAAVLRGLTETPIGDGPKRSENLERLRNEVGLLQTELDALDLRVLDPNAPAYGGGTLDLPSSVGGLGGATQAAGDVTTGLTAAQRAALFGGDTDPSDAQATTPENGGSTVGSQSSFGAGGTGGAGTKTSGGGATAPENGQDASSGSATQPVKPGPEDPAPGAGGTADGEPGYSADPVKHASALYRAGRYQEGFALIAKLTEPAAVYQQARFLEKLGRLDEAIAALESVDGKLPEGYEAQRAQSDLEFFRWKRDFLERIPEPNGNGTNSAGGGR